MRIRNDSRLDDDEVADLLRFAATGINDSGVLVHLLDTTSTFRGWAWDHCPRDRGYPPSTKYVVRLYVPSTDAGMEGYWTNVKRIRRLWPDGIPVDDWRDGFVFLAAHEFRHTWQYRHRKKGKGEYDAEKHAHRILNRWREATGRAAVPPVKQPNPFEGCTANGFTRADAAPPAAMQDDLARYLCGG